MLLREGDRWPADRRCPASGGRHACSRPYEDASDDEPGACRTFRCSTCAAIVPWCYGGGGGSHWEDCDACAARTSSDGEEVENG